MAAFALTLAVFAFWSLVGWALVGTLLGGRHLIRNALLSPVVGSAAVGTVIFECNRWGLAVQACGPAVTVFCGIAALGLLWRFRLPFPAQRLAPFAAVAVAGALLVGYPMLLYGFNWVSYGNDDMANYVLGAGEYLKRGYLSSFDPRVLLDGRDMGISHWIPDTLFGVRCGSELTLAWVMSVTKLSGHQVFMPVIVALHMSLICATGALVTGGRRRRMAALVTCAWVAVSSLVTLGTIYQLIAQVFGIGLLAAAGALLLEPAPSRNRATVKRAVLGGLIFAALGFTYPEVLPFILAALGLSHAIALLRKAETISSAARFVAIALGTALVFWNNFADCVPSFLIHQAQFGLQKATPGNMLFPYFLMPSGLPTFWGFLAIAQPMGRPLIDIAIVAGLILVLLAAVATVWQAWRGQAAALIAVVMLVLAVGLGRASSDFGLYKIAMYSQPFLLGTLALALLGTKGVGIQARWIARLSAIVLVAGLGLHAQLHYVSVSAEQRPKAGGFVEIPEASSRGLISQLKVLGERPRRPLVVSDAANVVLAKFEAAYLPPSRQEYSAKDYFSQTVGRNFREARWYADLVRPGYTQRSQALLATFHEMQTQVTFDMHGGPTNSFVRPHGREGGEADYSLVSTGPSLSVLNRHNNNGNSSAPMVTIVPSEQVRDHLVQIDSELGRHYYLSFAARGEGRVAMFQLEPDYFNAGRSMAAIGRVLVFEVLHPSTGLRLKMDYTASLQSDGVNAIPPAEAVGEQRSGFGAVGRGSARLFSPPLRPQIIGGRQYLAIDMGKAGRSFPEHRSGLMRLYGTAILLDSRRVTGFVRDISAVDAREYENRNPPASVAHFPADLACNDLEYSGIYEDGWVAEQSFLKLKQPQEQAELMVKVMVPGLGQKAPELRILVDGREAATANLRPGENEVRTMVNGPPGLRRIDLQFDSTAALPAPDGRPVAAQLRFAGFSGSEARKQDIAEPPVAVRDHWYPFETFGGQSFRWVDTDAHFTIAAATRESGELAMDLEPGPGMGSKPMSLHVVLPNGRTRMLSPVSGRQTMEVKLALAAGLNELSLRCDEGGIVIPADPRTLNFRVFRLTWTPASRAR